jgi:uncharacterized protein (TIGR01777 family)
MRILISGASGLIGSAVASALDAQGHTIMRLVRGSARAAREVAWTPGIELAPEIFRDVDAVLHLAGRSVAGRWTDRVKAEIRESRIPATAALARSIAASYNQFGRPSTFIGASAIGYYGSRGDEILTEQSPSGNGFLCEVCRQWEAAADPAREAGVRVVNPRIAVVLSEKGGALAKVLLPFRLGVGGRIGSGHQWFSWISLDDLVSILVFALTNEKVSGPINAASPSPVTNADFTKTLAAVLRRPAIIPVPAIAARLMFSSEGAEEMLLASQRVAPAKLEELGFEFHDPGLRAALTRMLADG